VRSGTLSRARNSHSLKEDTLPQVKKAGIMGVVHSNTKKKLPLGFHVLNERKELLKVEPSRKRANQAERPHSAHSDHNYE